MKTIVDGIEMFLACGNYSIRCDKCGVVFGTDYPRVAGVYRIQRDARAAGWTGPMTRETDQDRCPDCKER